MADEDRPPTEPEAPAQAPQLAEPEAATASNQVPRVTKEPASPRATLAGRVWIAIVIAAILLIALIIFVAENSQKVTISFLGAHGRISLALAILIAAVAGVLITLLVGSARILQLRREVQRRRRASRRHGDGALTSH